jgi:hypothetical protein
MPGEEEIKDLLLRFHADTASAWRHERDGIATFAARAILSLFAPILAEKEREISTFDQREVEWNEAMAGSLQNEEDAHRKLEAAEAALAKIKAKHAEWRKCMPADWEGDPLSHAIEAAAIRAQGE